MQFDAESGCLNNYISPDLISTYVSRPFSRINISEIAEERDCYLEMLFTFAQQALERTI